MLLNYFKFDPAINYLGAQFTDESVHTDTWQGVNISTKPEMAMHEILNSSFSVPLYSDNYKAYQEDINPNLPWADDHFEQERVGGQPLNPGETWKQWPNAKSAEKFLDAKGQFNHSYAERFWPKWAGVTPDGKLVDKMEFIPGRFGIRGNYGDLADVISLLSKDPLTRQAYLPVFFPEDTGDANAGRKPCTLGYHFICRNGRLHVTYYIRSCDFIRHFRDDIYLTVRLLIWVLEKLREIDGEWKKIIPGDFTMHITSLHMFRNDYLILTKENKDG